VFESEGEKDGFIGILDLPGQQLLFYRFFGEGNIKLSKVIIAPDGNLFFAGSFKKNLQVSPWNHVISFDTNDRYDMFFGKISGVTLNISAPVSTSDKISIYPNPACDYITIDAEFIPEKIIIYSVEGKVMTEENPAGNNTLVSISGFPKGIYFMEIKNGNEKVFHKFIKAQ